MNTRKHLLLITLNSRFLQSSLALPYLKAYLDSGDFCITSLLECTIQENPDEIAEKIYFSKPDAVGFSCYIWNIELTLRIVSMIKTLIPNVPIIFGGPEASFRAEEITQNHPVDYVIFGEGEIPLYDVCSHLFLKTPLQYSEYIYSRKDTAKKKFCEISDLDSIPSPYSNAYSLEHPFVYLETSRGCPYNCSYCSSSVTKKVRSFSMDRIKSDILRLIEAPHIDTIRIIDRTFNFSEPRAIEIIQFIFEQNREKIFQIEVKPDIASDSFLAVFSNPQSRLIQFEIGIQTFNQKALTASNRVQNTQKALYFINYLLENSDAHLHIDLIAGLPDESYSEFMNSLDTIAQCRPQTIQLGTLKILPGCAISRNTEYGIVRNPFPPYQVYQTNRITYEEMLKLCKMEKLINTVYNSRQGWYFSWCAVNHHFNKFSLFLESLYNFWDETVLQFHSVPRRKLYEILFAYIKTVPDTKLQPLLQEALTYDYLKTSKSREQLPDFEKIEKKSNTNRQGLSSSDPLYMPSISRHIKKYTFLYDIEACAQKEKTMFEDKTVIYFDTENIPFQLNEQEKKLLSILENKMRMGTLLEQFDENFIRSCFKKGLLS